MCSGRDMARLDSWALIGSAAGSPCCVGNEAAPPLLLALASKFF